MCRHSRPSSRMAPDRFATAESGAAHLLPDRDGPDRVRSVPAGEEGRGDTARDAGGTRSERSGTRDCQGRCSAREEFGDIGGYPLRVFTVDRVGCAGIDVHRAVAQILPGGPGGGSAVVHR